MQGHAILDLFFYKLWTRLVLAQSAGSHALERTTCVRATNAHLLLELGQLNRILISGCAVVTILSIDLLFEHAERLSRFLESNVSIIASWCEHYRVFHAHRNLFLRLIRPTWEPL